MVPLLAQLLVDPYDAVRSRAALALRTILGDDNLEYDFLVPEANRESVQADILRKWEAQALVRKGDERSELLLKPNGQLDQERFDRLLRWRDNREVFLSE